MMFFDKYNSGFDMANDSWVTAAHQVLLRKNELVTWFVCILITMDSVSDKAASSHPVLSRMDILFERNRRRP